MDKPKCEKAQLVLIKTHYVVWSLRQQEAEWNKQVFTNGKDVSDDNSASTDLRQIEVSENNKNATGGISTDHRIQSFLQ